jgi:hypothetical protein
MVTVEVAFASIALAAVVYFLIGVFAIVFTQLRVVDAATAITRQAAREDAAAVAQIEANLPGDAVVTRRDEGDLVRIHVDLTFRPWGRWLTAVTVSADAETRREG